MQCITKGLFSILLFFGPIAWSVKGQGIRGQLVDSISKEKIIGADIRIDFISPSITTDQEGRFEIPFIPNASAVLRFHCLGYFDKNIPFKDLSGEHKIIVFLKRAYILSEEILVRSTRSQAMDGTVFTDIHKKEIEKNNLGQDLPFLLENTPSVVATSQAGAGIGYTGLRIRGSDATRINVTLNGIPFNDSESLGTYFVDIPDIAGSISSIQIQRGVGTSTNGAGAFGGSINIETSNFKPNPFVSISGVAGSYNTFKNSVEIGSGLLSSHWNFSLRLSNIVSDGYIERASSTLKSMFFSAGYFGKNEFLKANIFSGTEKTYQVFNGVPEDSLLTHRRYNPFTYPNQTDNYKQNHYQLFYSKLLNTNLTMNVALHLTQGKGYYEEFENKQAFSDYWLPNILIGVERIDSTNLIRRQWLHNYFYGTTFSLIYSHPKGHYSINWGGAYNQYKGAHYGNIIWAQYAQNIPIDYQYYSFNGFKTDFNTFGKVLKEVNAITLSVDMQYRRIYYQFLGFDQNKNNTTQIAILNFFNPKIGINYRLTPSQEIYGSFGIGHKEPNQLDYSGSTPSGRPNPESLKDLELGYRFHNNRLGFSVNLYDMIYKNQLVLEGQINEVGAYINTNVLHSYRLGIETDWRYKINTRMNIVGNLSFSRNKIENFLQYLSDDQNRETLIIHPNTDISFSPKVVSSGTIEFIPLKDLTLSFVSKFVGKQYLDNTQDESRKIDRYFVENAMIQYDLKPEYKKNFFKEISLSIKLNNILNNLYVSDGYTSPTLVQGKLFNYNNYFPQAPFNFLLGIMVKL